MITGSLHPVRKKDFDVVLGGCTVFSVKFGSITARLRTLHKEKLAASAHASVRHFDQRERLRNEEAYN